MSDQTIESIIGGQFPKRVIPLIDEAHQTIKIVVFDWRWYPNDPGNPVQLFNQALVRAVRRGVVVQAVTNVVAIQKFLIDNGIRAKQFISKGIVHAKLMILDGKHVVLGSHNYTQYGFSKNQELSVLMLNCDDVQQYVSFFNGLWT